MGVAKGCGVAVTTTTTSLMTSTGTSLQNHYGSLSFGIPALAVALPTGSLPKCMDVMSLSICTFVLRTLDEIRQLTDRYDWNFRRIKIWTVNFLVDHYHWLYCPSLGI